MLGCCVGYPFLDQHYGLQPHARFGKDFPTGRDCVQIPNNQYVNIFNCLLILYFFCREHHPKQEGQADVLKMSEMEFFRHLRLTRKSFDDTLDLIHKAYGEEPSGTSLYLGPRKSLYLTLIFKHTEYLS